LEKLSRGSRHSKLLKLRHSGRGRQLTITAPHSSHRHPTISEYEADRVYELRKSPEVISALKLQLKAVSLGEKPWADNVLMAIMEKLNSFEPST
jgi:hypothetical protein